MQELIQVMTWIDENGEVQVQAYDPNNPDPELRKQLEQNACDCPICAAMLKGEDPVEAMAMNRAERRALKKINRGKRKRASMH